MIHYYKKSLYIFATVACILMIVSTTYCKFITTGTSFNEITILLILMMFTNPLINLFRKKQEIIYNPIYNICLSALGIYATVVSVSVITNYYLSLISSREVIYYFFNDPIIMICFFLLLFSTSTFIKKEKKTNNKYDYRITFLFTMLLSLVPFIGQPLSVITVVSFCLAVLSLMLMFREDTDSTEVQFLYFLLFLFSALIGHVISAILMYHLYIRLSDDRRLTI